MKRFLAGFTLALSLAQTALASAPGIPPTAPLGPQNSGPSRPVALFSGTWFNGGTGTTTTPHILVQPSGAAPVTSWNTNGTALGINAASGFGGNLVDAYVNGVHEFTVSAGGAITAAGNLTASALFGGAITLIEGGTTGCTDYSGTDVNLICVNSPNNVLELQQTNASSYSAIGFEAPSGIEQAAIGVGNASSIAQYANAEFLEITGASDLAIIAGYNNGRDIDINGSTGNFQMYASSGSQSTAYGTWVFGVQRSNGAAYFGHCIRMDPAGNGYASNSNTCAIDGVGAATFGSLPTTSGRAGCELLPLNICDPGAGISFLKQGIYTVQIVVDGTSYNDVNRGLGIYDHDNGNIEPFKVEGNGTGQVDISNIKDKSYAYSTPGAAATVVIADTADRAVMNPAGTLATLTVQLPTCSSTYDGKIAYFSSSQIISALTVTATAGSVLGAGSALTAGSGEQFLCRGATTTWNRTL
jgi:hypothetical protein